MTTGLETAVLPDAERRTGAERPLILPAGLLHVLRPIMRLAPQFSRYVVVSVLALGVDFAVFLTLTHLDAMKASWAGVTGYAAGLALHFLLSSRFVFERRGLTKSQRRLLAEFVASGLIGIAITWSIIAISVELLGLPPVAGKVLAVGISFVAVYRLRRAVVFKS